MRDRADLVQDHRRGGRGASRRARGIGLGRRRGWAITVTWRSSNQMWMRCFRRRDWSRSVSSLSWSSTRVCSSRFQAASNWSQTRMMRWRSLTGSEVTESERWESDPGGGISFMALESPAFADQFELQADAAERAADLFADFLVGEAGEPEQGDQFERWGRRGDRAATGLPRRPRPRRRGWARYR